MGNEQFVNVKKRERIKREVAKCTVLCAHCHAKEHYELARRNKIPSNEGLAAQFLDVEQALSVSQEEEFTHTIENNDPVTGL